MESILLFGVFEGLIIFLLILLKRKKTVSDYLLSSFFLIYSLNTFLSYLEIYNRTHGYPYPLFFFVSTPFLLLHWPVLWLYVKSLTDQHFKFRPVYLLNLIPFVLCIVLFTFEYYTRPLNEKIIILQSESFKQQWDYPVVIVTMTLSSLVYLSWAATLVGRYNRKIKVYFSETSRYDLYWLRVLMIASAVIYTVIYLAFAIDLIVPLAPFSSMHQASFILGAVYLIVLGFFGHRQGNLFSEKTIGIVLQEPGPISEIKYSVTVKENDFILSLLKYMNENKPFLIPEITLSTLASELDVTPDYLSGIINNKLGKNFFDFINHYRIEEFKTRSLAAENKKFTLLSIAYDCGFNSKATFNRVFKNVTGITPGEYASR
ncbi:MAG TPA: helix-turn-helix domain-containing protein [Bacteroidales bacterium]|nr:helix-turn-helix domain-containing protein [Bacteroidales bacterium]